MAPKVGCQERVRGLENAQYRRLESPRRRTGVLLPIYQTVSPLTPLNRVAGKERRIAWRGIIDQRQDTHRRGGDAPNGRGTSAPSGRRAHTGGGSSPRVGGGRVKKLPFRRTTTRVRRLGFGLPNLRP